MAAEQTTKGTRKRKPKGDADEAQTPAAVAMPVVETTPGSAAASSANEAANEAANVAVTPSAKGKGGRRAKAAGPVIEAEAPVEAAPAEAPPDAAPAKAKGGRRAKASASMTEVEAPVEGPADAAPAKPKRASKAKAAAPVAEVEAPVEGPADAAPAKPKRASKGKAAAPVAEAESPVEAGPVETPPVAAPAKPKSGRKAKAAPSVSEPESPVEAAPESAAPAQAPAQPKRGRKAKGQAADAVEPPAEDVAEPVPAKKTKGGQKKKVDREAKADREAKGGRAAAEAVEAPPPPVEEPIFVPEDARWYVVHTYSGYENKVKQNLEHRIESMGMLEQIFHVVVPVEEEVDIKDGQRRIVERKIFPGYVLVHMSLTDESWSVVRNTPGVTGFVGSGTDAADRLRPTPLRQDDVDKILRRMESEEPTIRVSFRPGQNVRIVDGPFTDFHGVVDAIDMERGKVRLMVNFFGRETPVELDFLQVEKV